MELILKAEFSKLVIDSNQSSLSQTGATNEVINKITQQGKMI